MQKTITIFIPAFNRADAVRRCIESVRATVDPRHRVVLVDDCSTEEGFEHAVKTALGDAPNMRYVRNVTHLGRIGTCNRADELAEQGTDVLLLSPDATVTAGSIEDMIECLAACERHGVVCPRSNEATPLTFPPLHESCEDFRTKSHDLWKQVHQRLPRCTVIPAGVGFCMLIRRELIERFGLFDPVYGSGYNGENDFCMRIARFGFSTIMANHAYVFHDGCGSCSADGKRGLERKNRRILAARYPEYSRAVAEYARHLPWHEHFGELLAPSGPHPRILLDLSGLIPSHNGTSEYALALTSALLPVLRPHADVSVLTTRGLDTFFGISSLFPRTLIVEDLTSERFDLAFMPQQPFLMQQLERIHRTAVRFAFCMQDVIGLRSHAIRHPGSVEAIRAATHFTSAIVSVSQASLDDVRAWMGTKLRPGLATAAIHHAYREPVPSDPAAESVLPGEPFVFLVGNHYEHKALLPALDVLPTDRPIVVLGSAGDREACRKKGVTLLESGKLSVGLIDALYRRAAVVAFPSQYEGFGFPFLRAAEYGTPVVAFDAAVSREIVAAFGLQHLVTLCPDFPSFAVAVRQTKGEKLPPPLKKRSWDDVANETATILLEVVRQPVEDAVLAERFVFFEYADAAKIRVVKELFTPAGIMDFLGRRLSKIFSSCMTVFFG